MNNLENSYLKNLDSLTVKEFKILELAKTGKGNKEIAELFNISVDTVKTHRKNIMRKMGIKGKNEMTKFLISLLL